MEALLVALILGLALLLGGAGYARHASPDEASVPLGSAGALAAFVILVGDTSAFWGYRGIVALLAGVLLVCGGWLWPARLTRSRLRDLFGRPSPVTLVMAVVALALALPLILLPVPLDTDAQGFGYLALMIRNGGTLTTLAPWHPEISYLYTPGALLIFSALSQISPGIPMSAVMMGAAHVAALFFIWLAWDFGREIGLSAEHHFPSDPRMASASASRRWGWAAGISAALSVGLWTALMDSHYTAIFALLFALACVTCVFRFLRTGRRSSAALAGLYLAAVAITQVDTAIALALGYVSLLLLVWLAVDRPSARRWLILAALIPASAFAAISPWLLKISPLLETGIRSPFTGYMNNWRVLLLYSGLIWPALAVLGAAIYLRYRPLWALTMIGWLAATVELSSAALLQRAFPAVATSLLRFNFPFSLAWHAPIIPTMALSSGALVWLAVRLNLDRIRSWFIPILAGAGGLLVIAGVFHGQLLVASKGRLQWYGAFTSANDMLAMGWLRGHAPPDARVLNYPGDYEGGRDWEADWAPVVSERDCVYFRKQPFFAIVGAAPDTTSTYTEQTTLLAFWRDPADPANARLLDQARISYVLVPEAVGDPASMATAWRWQPPALLTGVRSLPGDAPYLRLVFAAGGAQVFEVVDRGA